MVVINIANIPKRAKFLALKELHRSAKAKLYGSAYKHNNLHGEDSLTSGRIIAVDDLNRAVPSKVQGGELHAR